ncbi:MAG: RHS repeat-associated core domain-containing protein, partial [Bacteroidota bacterium]
GVNIESYQFECGRIILDEAGNAKFQYKITDHLGNTVVYFEDKDGDGVIEENPTDGNTSEVLQRELYYPFGLQFNGTAPLSPSPGQDYLYNGKELMEGTGLYNYGARYYDPAIARWTGVDPLAGHSNLISFSPYHYVYNNPILITDPDGRCPDCWEFTKGFGRGAWGGIKSSAQGLYTLVTDPGAVADGAWHAVTHPRETINAIGDQISDTYGKLTSGDPGQVGEVFGGLTVVAGEAFLGTKGITKIKKPKLRKASDAASDADNVPRPSEPYNRRKHYGNTPRQSDRDHFGTSGTGDVVDHDPPLVQRYYEGDPSVGEPPGYTQTPEQRRASANDRSRMQRQSGEESNSQGGRMSWYSRIMKKKWFGNGG